MPWFEHHMIGTATKTSRRSARAPACATLFTGLFSALLAACSTAPYIGRGTDYGTGIETYAITNMVITTDQYADRAAGIKHWLETKVVSFGGEHHLVRFVFTTDAIKPIYRDCHGVAFVADEKPVSVLDTTYRDEPRGVGFIQTITARMEASEFRKLAAAKRIGGRLCNANFRFTREQRQAISEYAEGLPAK